MTSLEPTEQTSCRYCGQAYRRPIWGREYLCPACGRPLERKSRPAPRSGLAGVAGVAAVLILTGMGAFRFAAVRAEQNRRQQAPTEPPSAPVTPPPRMEALLREKLAIFDADLALDPQADYLLWRCADTSLALALLHRDREPAEASRWLQRARRYAERLGRITPGTRAHQELERRLGTLGSLIWGAPALRYDTRQLRPAAGFAIARGGGIPPASGRAAIGGGGGYPTGGYPAGGYLGGYPAGGYPTGGYPMGGYPMGGYPTGGYPSAGPPPPISHPSAGPPPISYPSAGAPSLIGPPLEAPRRDSSLPRIAVAPELSAPTPPRIATRDFPPTPEVSAQPSVDELLEEARKERAGPSPDPRALWTLADRLSTAAGIPPRRTARFALENPDREALAREAIQTYLHAARLLRLRSDRATAYHDAARLYTRMREDEDAYRCLKRAVENIPFAPVYWQDLRDVALRLGKTAESREAAVQLRRWSHPSAILPP